MPAAKPLVLITGAGGNIGDALASALQRDYWIVGLDRGGDDAAERGRIPAVLLHLAGLYDDQTAVPTLAQQIARIYEREVQSMLYAGDVAAGQSMLHRDDMIDAFRRIVDRRAELPPEITILSANPKRWATTRSRTRWARRCTVRPTGRPSRYPRQWRKRVPGRSTLWSL